MSDDENGTVVVIQTRDLSVIDLAHYSLDLTTGGESITCRSPMY